MDEVHIRSVASYKRGKVLGSIDITSDPHNCIFNQCSSNLLGSSSAIDLFPIITKTMSDIKNCNLFVDALLRTHNNILNVILFKLFFLSNQFVKLNYI